MILLEKFLNNNFTNDSIVSSKDEKMTDSCETLFDLMKHYSIELSDENIFEINIDPDHTIKQVDRVF
ncbi:MAG: hypothetical protein WC964_02415 [Acholeplasmataceae bacterium]